MSRLLLATGNPHKVTELRDLLAGTATVLTPAELDAALEVEEDGDTFAANACKKAEAYVAATGELCVADDSGLCVAALDGAPGVHSARFAVDAGRGEGDAANRVLLLERLAEVSDDRRQAHFCCAIAVAEPGRPTRVFEGESHGAVTRVERGDSGFGYDPLFEAPGGQTFAELDLAAKQAISHRGRALRLAAPYIFERLRARAVLPG